MKGTTAIVRRLLIHCLDGRRICFSLSAYALNCATRSCGGILRLKKKARTLAGKRKCSRHLGIAIFMARHRCFSASSRHRRLKKVLVRFPNFATLIPLPPFCEFDLNRHYDAKVFGNRQALLLAKASSATCTTARTKPCPQTQQKGHQHES